jgi:ABC-2 type transport system ATP-binding protein
MRGLIRSLRNEHTVLFSSHLLPEVSHVCDRVLILHRGALLGQPKMSELAVVLGMHAVLVRIRGEAGAARALLSKLEGVHEVEVEQVSDGQTEFRLLLKPDVRPQVARVLIEGGFELLRLDRPELDLETVFLRLTGHKAPAPGTKHANGGADSPA